MIELNDVHSALNPTVVAQVVRPATLVEVQEAVRHAARSGLAISMAGGRHAMGGQQFGSGCLHLDMTDMTQVLHADPEHGLLHMQAGAMWPAVMNATRRMAEAGPGGHAWAIRQKQTGVDDVTLAGSIAANAHGRGLLMQPLVDDIEDLTLVTADAEVARCSRHDKAELFSLVVGGYGLFGAVVSATLRLTPRQRVQRLVDVLDLRDAMNAVQRRVEQGCIYGDFQFVIDPHDEDFLTRGVLSCYKPAASAPDEEGHADLSQDAWLQLLGLAHDNKAKAFKLYAQHYVGTHGNVYWADTMQLSTYIPSYADYLERSRPAQADGAARETLVIGEHYVPREHIVTFMESARGVLAALGVEVIYGTIRSILADRVTFLPWAKDDYACVIFNLRTPHTQEGKAKTALAFEQLTEVALSLGGNYFLTYHRYANASQVRRGYPQMPEFLAKKRQWDPQERFQSDWYRHYRAMFPS
jgi:FAD/FMN-containing dehydrogenase